MEEENLTTPETELDQAATRKKKKERKLAGINAPDIRYRGPFSYQTLRIIGWFSLFLAVLGFTLSVTANFAPPGKGVPEVVTNILTNFSVLMTPMFLLANFSLILSERRPYKRILIFYAGITAGIAFLFYVYGERLLFLVARIMSDTPEEQRAFLDAISAGFLYKGFNIFLDLLLCTLFMYFLNYNPKKFFQGKTIIIFRLLAILPLAYEIVSNYLKVCIVYGFVQSMPIEIAPWLTTKPIMAFIAFVAIALFIKLRQHIFLRRHGNYEQWKEYMETNANSFHVGLFIFITFLVAAVADFFLLVIMLAFGLGNLDGVDEASITAGIETLSRIGIGGTVVFALVAPVGLLFSYTRVPKRPQIDLLIPVAGILVAAITAIEGVFAFFAGIGG